MWRCTFASHICSICILSIKSITIKSSTETKSASAIHGLLSDPFCDPQLGRCQRISIQCVDVLWTRPAGCHRSERDRNGGGCMRNSLQLNLSTLKIMINSFNVFQIWQEAPKQVPQDCLLELHRSNSNRTWRVLRDNVFLQDFASVSFTKSEASERHIRKASEQLWVGLLRPRRIPQRQFWPISALRNAFLL